MSRPTVLITGADGFVGRHLVRAAPKHGFEAVGLHRSPGVDSETRVRVDLLDPLDTAKLERAVAAADAVVHAAALVRLFGRRAPVVRANETMTRRVVEACERGGRPPLVLLSSASVLFEPGDQLGLGPDAPLPARALSGYAASKQRSEAVVQDYGGRSVILRPQAIYGPGDRTLVPGILRAAEAGRWAWVGRDVRADLVSVHNVVEWTYRALERPAARGVYHLSDGDPRPAEELFVALFARAGVDPGARRVPRRLAGAAGAVVGGLWAAVAPEREPPLTRFVAEVMGSTKTVDPARTFAELGPPAVAHDAAFRAMLEGLHVDLV